jgi:hypothetical protein
MKLPSWREAQIARDIGPRPKRPPRNVAWVLAQLQGGAVRRWWMLSDGTTLTGNTAKAVVSDPRVVDCGDALFPGVRGQTFRFAPVQS